MPYQRNSDLSAYENLTSNYDAETLAWQQMSDQLDQQYDDAFAAYEEALAAWQENPEDGDGNPLEEPTAPTQTPKLPEPVAPVEPPLYEARVTAAPEQITTPTGPAIVAAGRTIVTAPDGSTYAMSADEFAHGYTEVRAKT
jgi:hypothetical protein